MYSNLVCFYILSTVLSEVKTKVFDIFEVNVPDAILLALTFLVVIRALLREGEFVYVREFPKWLWALLVLTVISLSFTNDFTITSRYIVVFCFKICILLVVFNFVRTREEIHRVIASLVIVILLNSLLVILQAVTHFGMLDYNVGFFHNKNECSAFILAFLPFALLYRTERRRKIIPTLLIAVIVAAIIIGGSRSALLGTILVFLIFNFNRLRFFTARVLILMSISAFLVYFFLPNMFSFYSWLIGDLFNIYGANTTTSYRLGIYAMVFEFVGLYPYGFGMGAYGVTNNFNTFLLTLSEKELRYVTITHSVPAEFWVGLGYPGLFLLLGFYSSVLLTLRKFYMRISSIPDRDLLLTSFAALSGIFANSLFYNNFLEPPLWVVLGIAFAHVRMVSRGDPERGEAPGA